MSNIPQDGVPGGVPAMDADARNWAMFAHLSAIAGAFVAGIGSWVGPLVIWLVRREVDAFSTEHAKEALNFNLFMLLLGIVAGFLALVTLGVGLIVIAPIGLAVFVVFLVFTIQAAMAANAGRPYRYPITIRFIS